MPRDVLMDVFWRDAEPEAARDSLHVALSGVRRALRGDRAGAAAGAPARRRTGSPSGWTSGSTRRRSSGPAGRVAGPRRPATRAGRAAGVRAGRRSSTRATSSPTTRTRPGPARSGSTCGMANDRGRAGRSRSTAGSRRPRTASPRRPPGAGRRSLQRAGAPAADGQLRPLRAATPGAAAVPPVPGGALDAFRIGPAPETVALYESLRDRALRLPAVAAGNVAGSWRPTTSWCAPRAPRARL